MDLIGQNLGQYRVVEPIGAGGMATVYKAFQAGLDRYVAVKVLPAQHALTPGFKERFVREAKAVAQLSHPNILPIHDFGIDNDVSYFVMKYVPGQTLRDVMSRQISLPQICDYIDQISGALDHAHQKGILHRDIKPVNVLMEGDWLLLADFGLAKIIEGTQALTATGSSMGTPAYVSPEQAVGKPVDHRTDIYSLGVILYEMVVGKVPYSGETPMGVMFKHVYEPLPMPRQLKPDLPEAIEQVILKALAKNPEDRYSSAGDLAQALRAAVETKGAATVMATPPASPQADAQQTVASQPGITRPEQPDGPPTQLSGPPGRRPLPWPWIAAGLVGLLLVAGAGFLWFGSSNSDSPSTPALAGGEAGAGLSATETSDAQSGAGFAATETPVAATAAETATPTAQPTQTPFPSPPVPTLTPSPTAAGQAADASSSTRSFADVPQLSAATVLGRGPINDLAVSPNGQTVAVASSQGVWLYDSQSLEFLRLLPSAGGGILAVDWSPDGGQIAGGGDDALLYVWDATQNTEAQTLSGHTARVVSIEWSPDGTRLASGSPGASASTVRVWEVSTGQQLAELTGHLYAPYDVAWSPDGGQIASASRDKTIRIWDVASGGQLRRLESHLGEVNSVDWSADGTQLVSASNDLTIRVWDTGQWQEQTILTGHTDWILEAVLSPDETQIASGSMDGSVRVWDVATGEMVQLLEGHTQPGVIVSWSTDGTQLISAGSDGSLRVWSVSSGQEMAKLAAHTSLLQDVAWSPDGSLLAAVGFDGVVHVWDVASQTELQSLPAAGELLLSLTWSPEGRQVAVGTAQGTINIWDVTQGQLEQTLSGHADQVKDVAWSPDGSPLASASLDGTIKLWDPLSGAQLRELAGHDDVANQLVWSPDGSQLASGSDDRTVIVWDAASGQALRQFTNSGGLDAYKYYYKARGTAWIDSIDWSPDGKRLVTGSSDFVARIWDAASGAELRILEGPEVPVLNAAWAPDSSRVALTGVNGHSNIVIWEAISDTPLYLLPDHTDTIYGLDWSPDGSQLASTGNDGVIRLWDVPQ